MSAVDRSTLWSAGYDESVEVNQRALIDKVLARYSGEFTVFRELLQNSDDAASEAVEIRFDTKQYLERIAAGYSREDKNTPDLKQSVHQWTFMNNGIILREEDWSRLKKIAEGNPDEEKIGAFGVGFYSLFSVTEEPFVRSGDQWMGFYWKDKKDQLFARRGNLPESTSTGPYGQWTTFEMVLREDAPIPNPFDFVRFLTSSITFMAHLETVTVWFDGIRLAQVTKARSIPKELPVPSGLRNTSDAGMMIMKSVKITPVNISAEVLRLVYTSGSKPRQLRPDHRSSKVPTNNGFFSALFSSLNASVGSSPVPPPPPSPLPPTIAEEPDAIISSHVLLSVFCGEVDVNLTQKMNAELFRSTKKNPPSRMKLELIYTGKDEYDASKKDEESLFEKTGSLFQGLRADLDGAGAARIFIGHSTGQTTGLGGHVSGRFIPTVERESIDLVDRNVAAWNKELLFVGGLLARVAYEAELANIRALWSGASETVGEANARPAPDLCDWLQNRCLHALRFFTAHVSTPSPMVGSLLQAGFFSSSLDGSFPIVSTAGVLDARNVRGFDVTYVGFLKQLPVLPSVIATNAKPMTDALRARGMIQDITFADVLNELRSRALSEEEMFDCLQWRIQLDTGGVHPAYVSELRREFLTAAVFMVNNEKSGERVIPLSTIKTIVLRSATTTIPTDGPLPDHTLPFSLSRRLKPDALFLVFGWSELTIPSWLENLVSPLVGAQSPEFDLSKSATWAETVLTVLARSWSSLSGEHQAKVVNLLESKACIPTKFGMKLPKESYFLNANVFPDLPIVTMPKGTVVKGNLEKVLLALGVQQHVDLQVVFHRMIRTGDWGIPDLIRYLVAVQDSLTHLEIDRLSETVAFTKESLKDQQIAGPSATSPVVQKEPPATRFRAKDLYEPSSSLRELGLPIIAWGTTPRWKSSTEEAKFLFRLGLRRYPPLRDLLCLAAGPDPLIREASLKYFIENVPSKYTDYDPRHFVDLAFVPARNSDGVSSLCKPNEVFTEQELAIMGFSVVNSSLPADWVTKLKLSKAPPTSMIFPILEGRPPRGKDTARRWFEVLAGHLSDFSSSDFQRLSSMAFIPVGSSSISKDALHSQRFLPPSKCYLGKNSKTQFHSQLFTFIDFGLLANSFLIACGVRNEPTVDELAQMLVADPRNFYQLAGGYDNFLVELRNIAVNYHGVSLSTRNRMKSTPCLVASRHVARTSKDKRKKNSAELSDDEGEVQWEHDLLLPNKIVIIDDVATYMQFDTVFSAPQEDYVEQLYSKLGSVQLSSLVREEYKPSTEIKDSTRALETRHLILERLPLFLHERTQSEPLITYDWLNNLDNFLVTEVGKLTLTRILQFGRTRMVTTQEVSAMAERKNKGPIRLWVGGGSQVDLYEVANSLCKVILRLHKLNDSLLFMTILSADLRALRRRGYNVDRILRQQKAERDKAIREQNLLAEIRQTENNSKRVSQVEPPNPANPKHHEASLKSGVSLFSNLRQRFQKPLSPPSKTSASPLSSESPVLPMVPTQSSPPRPPKSVLVNSHGTPDPMRPYTQDTSRGSDQGVTPHVNIEQNVRTAIERCKAENNSVVHTQAQMMRVKEAMNEGYCDIMGAMVLELVDTISQFKVFVSSQGTDDTRAALGNMHDAIVRFGELVLRPLINVYNIPSTSVHIFYDQAGPLIAFNRNGSLFMNLRYYIAWHDISVQKGDLAQAYTSWYFSLAHEIAHNLVHPHNSEHEFYFSTICEQYMTGLTTLLIASGTVQGR